MSLRRILSLTLLIIAASAILTTAAVTNSESSALLRVRVETPTALDKSHVASLGPILEARPGKNEVLALLQAQQVEALKKDGYVVEIVAGVARKAPAARAPEGFPCYMTPAEIEAKLADYAGKYPGLTELMDIGDSWDKTQDNGKPGHDILMLKITNKDNPGVKPPFFLMASIHANEMLPSLAVEWKARTDLSPREA